MTGDGSQVEVLKRLLAMLMDEATAASLLEQESAEALVEKIVEVF